MKIFNNIKRMFTEDMATKKDVEEVLNSTANALDKVIDKLNDHTDKLDTIANVQIKSNETMEDIKKVVTYSQKQIDYIKDIIKYYPNAPHFTGTTKEEATRYLNKWAPVYQDWKHNNWKNNR
jgi:hypothetical protein